MLGNTCVFYLLLIAALSLLVLNCTMQRKFSNLVVTGYARRKVSKTTLKGSKILFDGRGLNSF